MSVPERLPCKTPGCTDTILPSTAVETGGFCQPCIQAQRRKAHEAFVRAHRKEVDPFAGLTDPVDIILAFHERRPYDELIHYLPLGRPLAPMYARLDAVGIERLLAVIVAAQDDDPRREHILCELVAYTTANVDHALRVLVDRGLYYPGMAFSRAGGAVRQALLAATATSECNHRALDALAWVDHPDARERFRQWRRNPPPFERELSIPASDYLHSGGWHILSDGSLQQLHLDVCWALVPADEGTSEPSEPCRIGRPTEEACSQCGRGLVDLLVLDRTDPRLSSIPWPRRQLVVRGCLDCVDTQFFDHSQPDRVTQIGAIERRDPTGVHDGFDKALEGSLVLSSSPRLRLHGASASLPDPLSQVGGLPAWIQEPGYLPCPACGVPMLFLAQIAAEDVMEHVEGVYYALACPGCQVTGVTYQQT